MYTAVWLVQIYNNEEVKAGGGREVSCIVFYMCSISRLGES